MPNKKISITFQTLTPLWTGDAWGENTQIRPSSIMGSLRFWFEVICYFAGITEKENYKDGKLNDDLNEKEFKKSVLENGTTFESVNKILTRLGISLPSIVFGCTGWKGLLRIKRIEEIEDYCFGNRLNLPFGIAVKKDFSEIKELNNFRELDRDNYSGWFFPIPYFFGKFEIIFEIEEKIIKPLFYPLLTFIEKYGFLGGKWNIGYGRVKIEKVEEKEKEDFKEINNWRREDFKFDNSNVEKISNFISKKNNFSHSTQSHEYLKFFLVVDSFYCFRERNFNNKVSNLPSIIKIAELNNNFNCYEDAIIQLLQLKAKIRNCLRPNNSISNKQFWHNFRHKLLGTTSNNMEGTKIISNFPKKYGMGKNQPE